MNLENLSDKQVEQLFEASFKIKEIFESQSDWRKLILDNEIYRKVFLLMSATISEQRRRLFHK